MINLYECAIYFKAKHWFTFLWKFAITEFLLCLKSTYLMWLLLLEGESCWWTIHPASKTRSEGEKVRVGDDLILVSVASERYLVGFHSFNYLKFSFLETKCVVIDDSSRYLVVVIIASSCFLKTRKTQLTLCNKQTEKRLKKKKDLYKTVKHSFAASI